MKKPKQVNNRTSNIDQIPDKELSALIMSGNKEALSFLYEKYVNQLFKYGYFLVPDKGLVEDAIHDLFIKLWSGSKNQNTIKSLKPYLFVSLRREILTKKKKESDITNHIPPTEEPLYSRQPSAEESLINEENDSFIKKSVQTYINTLTDRQREIIHLRFYQNLSYSEISDLMKIDQDYAYNLISKAFSALRKNLIQKIY